MLKKLILVVLVIALSTSLMFGCGTTQVTEKAETVVEEASEEAIMEEKEPVTIVLTTWDSGVGIDILNDAITEFNGLYPHITVEVQSIVQGYDEKLQIMNASGNTPDVFLMWNTPQFVESGIAANLNDLIERDNYDMSIYYPATKLWAEYKGGIYGLPKDVTPRAMYYNKNVFDEAGLAYPKDGWTWAEFTDTVKSLTNGKTGDDAKYGFIALSSQTYSLQGFIWANGGQITSDDGMTASGFVNSDSVIETISWYKDVFDSSARSLVATGEGNPGNAEFMSGKIALMDNGCWPIADLRNEPNLEYGVVAPPVPSKGAAFTPVLHSATWSMFEKSKNKDAAWEFIKFLGSKDGAKYIGNAGFSPTAIASLNDELGLADTELAPFLDILKLETRAPEFTKNARYFEADGAFQTACEKIFLADVDPKEALDEAAAIMDEILQTPIG